MGCVNSIFQFGSYRTKEGVAVEKSEPIQVKTVDPPVTKAADLPRYPPAEKKEEPLRPKAEDSLSKETVPQKPDRHPKNETPYRNIETKPPPVPLTKMAKEDKGPPMELEPVRVSTLQIELQPKPSAQTTAAPQKTEQTPLVSPTQTVKEDVKKIVTVKEEITPTGRIVLQETITKTVTEKESVDVKKHIIQPQHPTPVSLPTKEEEEDEDDEEEYEEEDEEEWETENVPEKKDDKHVEKAVVTIQAGIRGYLTRKALNQQKQDADIQKDGGLQKESEMDQDDLEESVTPTNTTQQDILTDSEAIKEVAAMIVDNVMRLAAEKVPEMVTKKQTSKSTESKAEDIVQSELPDIKHEKDGESVKESVERHDILGSQNSGNMKNREMLEHSLDESPQVKSAELFESDLQQGMDGVMEFDDEDMSSGEEEAEDENMYAAATKIQASFRGYKVRRELKEKHGVDGPNVEREGFHASGNHNAKNSTAHQTVDSDLTSTIKSDDVMKENITTNIASSQECDASTTDSQHSSDVVQEENFISDTTAKVPGKVELGSGVPTVSPDSIMGTDNIVFEAITDFGEERGTIGQVSFQQGRFEAIPLEDDKERLEKIMMQDSLELYPSLPSFHADKPKTSDENKSSNDVKELPPKNVSEDTTKKEQKFVTSPIKEDEEYESSSSGSMDEDADVERDLLNMDSAPWVISPAYHSEMPPPPEAHEIGNGIKKTETSFPLEQNTNPFLNHPVDDNLLLNFNNSSPVDSSNGSTHLPQQDQNYWLLEDNPASGQSENLLSFLGDSHPSLDAGNLNVVGQDLMGEDTPVSSQTSPISNKGKESEGKLDEPLKASNLPENTMKAL